MPATKGKILVIRGGAIGDFICTVPAISALRERFPETHLEVMGYPHVARLASAAGLVDEVQSIEARSLASFFARGGALPTPMAEYFERFAIILSYLYDPDQMFRTNVGLCSKAQFLTGPHRPNQLGSMHATETFLKPLERLAIFDADVVPRLRFTQQATPDPLDGSWTGNSGVLQAPRALVLHPGSGSERKNWPEAKWAELIQRLSAASSFPLMLVGGEAEGDRLERLASTVPKGRIQTVKQRPLPELGALFQGCAAFLGHDSGISHLAAAVGLPVLVLWGDSNAAVWRPRGPRVELLQPAAGLAALEVDTVYERLTAFLEDLR